MRSALVGTDGYILVLDTKGINVWCAVGKGTFGTDELVNRIELTGLHNVVNHRMLILPQLGATGVAAHEVKRRSGFMVEYGAVRAKDLPEYLKSHGSTPEMRQVRFNLNDRLVLIPVELVHVLLPMAIAAALLYFVGGLFVSAAAVAAILSGVVLFPIFLPWLPTSDFGVKGFILGGLAAVPFALRIYSGTANPEWWLRGAWALVFLLSMPPVTSYLALNFTGSTPFTSKSGVRREIFAYIPVMAVMFGTGIVLAIAVILKSVGRCVVCLAHTLLTHFSTIPSCVSTAGCAASSARMQSSNRENGQPDWCGGKHAWNVGPVSGTVPLLPSR